MDPRLTAYDRRFFRWFGDEEIPELQELPFIVAVAFTLMALFATWRQERTSAAQGVGDRS